jgi:hypothetical protein
MYVAQKANPIRICLMIWDRKMLRSGTRSFETLTSGLEFAIGVISGLLVLALGLSPLMHRIFATKKDSKPMFSKGLVRKRPYDMSTANTLAREARGKPSEYSQLPVLASPQHTRPCFCKLPDDAGERAGGRGIHTLGHTTS